MPTLLAPTLPPPDDVAVFRVNPEADFPLLAPPEFAAPLRPPAVEASPLELTLDEAPPLWLSNRSL
jgi:hypothetical protein